MDFKHILFKMAICSKIVTLLHFIHVLVLNLNYLVQYPYELKMKEIDKVLFTFLRVHLILNYTVC